MRWTESGRASTRPRRRILLATRRPPQRSYSAISSRSRRYTPPHTPLRDMLGPRTQTRSSCRGPWRHPRLQARCSGTCQQARKYEAVVLRRRLQLSLAFHSLRFRAVTALKAPVRLRPGSLAGAAAGGWQSALSLALSSAPWTAPLSVAELVSHVCALSWCAATVSAAPLPLSAAVSFSASLPASAVVLRACVLCPLILPFTLCVLSLALSVLLPAEEVALLLSASPLLRYCTLSMLSRVCAVAVMCLYTVLLVAVLSALS